MYVDMYMHTHVHTHTISPQARLLNWSNHRRRSADVRRHVSDETSPPEKEYVSVRMHLYVIMYVCVYVYVRMYLTSP
jgi:hypothetical protein